MYRLIIADDEDDERAGIRYLLDKYGFQFEVTEAADGAEALAILKERGADLLFTDVKMPFLTGLELAEQAKEIIPGLEIIFFSGYDDFDYVKQALSLQAVDYILKPVNPVEFQKVIALVLERMEKRRTLRQQSEQAQSVFILTRLLNQVPLEQLRKDFSAEQLAFLNAYARVIFFEFEDEFFGRVVADVKELSDKIQVKIPFPFELLDMNPQQGLLLLKQGGQSEAECQRMARSIHALIEQVYDSRCYLAIGPEFSQPDGLWPAYAQAEAYLENRFFYQNEFVYPLTEDEAWKRTDSEKTSQLMRAIENDVNYKDADGLRKDVELIVDICRNNGFQSYIYTRFICANLLKVLYQGLPWEEGQLAASVEQIYVCTNFSEIEAVLYGVLERLEQMMMVEQYSPVHVTALVEQYIHAHYMDGLSLELLAEKVYLTPHYLSGMFSQEKKMGINKYIKAVRMEKAKEFLRNTNMKIQDVCKAVGYTNISYFCKTFRNEFGVTPEKYRNQ